LQSLIGNLHSGIELPGWRNWQTRQTLPSFARHLPCFRQCRSLRGWKSLFRMAIAGSPLLARRVRSKLLSWPPRVRPSRRPQGGILALTTTDAARLTIVCPQNCSNCFGLPIRVDGPARQNNCADAREISHMNTSSS